MDGLHKVFRTDVGLTDLGTGELFSDKMRFVYLQLPCFTNNADDCENDFERWIYVLKNMETLNRLPWAAQNSVFQRLAEIAEVSAMTKEERMQYDGALKKYRDTLNAMHGAEQKGYAEGHIEGRAEERLNNARSLLANGVSQELVIKSLHLSEEEIGKLLAIHK